MHGDAERQREESLSLRACKCACVGCELLGRVKCFWRTGKTGRNAQHFLGKYVKIYPKTNILVLTT